eukprot:TRINITY_DN27920_c0_g2_i3.p1 TRINITY_DN27920_c0_g2~~TRINITY_DN27920_c0_g2_i3.p1  ORF type:complete len:324 (+),score=111.45 TRINITY_DN27920_c0_g2_i3:79-1050(+)
MVRRLQLLVDASGWVTVCGDVRKSSAVDGRQDDGDWRQHAGSWYGCAQRNWRRQGEWRGQNWQTQEGHTTGERKTKLADTILELATKFEVLETKFNDVYAKEEKRKDDSLDDGVTLLDAKLAELTKKFETLSVKQRKEETLEAVLKMQETKLAELTKKFEMLSVRLDGVFDEKTEEKQHVDSKAEREEKLKSAVELLDVKFVELELKTRGASENLQLIKDELDAHNVGDMLKTLEAKCRTMATHVEDYGKAFSKDIAVTKKELLKAIEENRSEILEMQRRAKQVDQWLKEMWEYVCKCTGKGKKGKGDDRNISAMTVDDYRKF